ncbi:TPA: hypothetical protein MYQ19_000923 [Klebsiella oxytoca]|nr:hypothetical protein [Klebsiella oxytoca]HCB1757366.1 hypothetical protein [Klebsiella oxytoca]HCB1837705.1 hypothetical protein [Klebsiella oxytoca]HCB1893324.1 hypothetical protein [Klebsiella oxytoca]
MTITLQAVNELIQSLESAGELSIKETKVMALAKAYLDVAAENVAARNAVQVFCDVVGANTDAICEEVGPEGVRAILAAMSATGNMPSTVRILAEIKSNALPANIAEIIDSGDLESILYASEASYSEEYRMAFYNFRQLREGADK